MRLNLIVCAVALALAGCQSPPPLGDAVAHNVAVQTVNPDAAADARPLTMSGERAALAQSRYAADKVKEPEDINTARKPESNGSGGTDHNTD